LSYRIKDAKGLIIGHIFLIIEEGRSRFRDKNGEKMFLKNDYLRNIDIAISDAKININRFIYKKIFLYINYIDL